MIIENKITQNPHDIIIETGYINVISAPNFKNSSLVLRLNSDELPIITGAKYEVESGRGRVIMRGTYPDLKNDNWVVKPFEYRILNTTCKNATVNKRKDFPEVQEQDAITIEGGKTDKMRELNIRIAQKV